MSELGPNRYGKSAVRLVAVDRGGDRHALRDLTVDIALEGDFVAAHERGDNSDLLATDTMRNVVYMTAREQGVGQLESFAAAVGSYLLAAGPTVARARVSVLERPWSRLAPGGEPHPHAFARGGDANRTAIVTQGQDGMAVEAGITELPLLRTTGSGWAGFLRERATTLPETDDRIFATSLSATWSYLPGEHDYDAVWERVRESIVGAFADHYSPSAQFTLRRVGDAVLAACDEIEEVSLVLPNLHHYLVDLEPFGLDNDNQIFHPADEPYGRIEGTIRRTETD